MALRPLVKSFPAWASTPVTVMRHLVPPFRKTARALLRRPVSMLKAHSAPAASSVRISAAREPTWLISSSPASSSSLAYRPRSRFGSR